MPAASSAAYLNSTTNASPSHCASGWTFSAIHCSAAGVSKRASLAVLSISVSHLHPLLWDMTFRNLNQVTVTVLRFRPMSGRRRTTGQNPFTPPVKSNPSRRCPFCEGAVVFDWGLDTRRPRACGVVLARAGGGRSAGVAKSPRRSDGCPWSRHGETGGELVWGRYPLPTTD